VTKKDLTTFERILQWLGNYNWYVVAAVTIGITLFEIYEVIRKKDNPTDPFHIVELLLYILILILVGVLVHFLVRANAAQTRTMKILEYKHNINLKLIELENWEALTDGLLKLPNEIVAIQGSRLFISSPISGELGLVTQWDEDRTRPLVFDQDCLTCVQERSDANYQFSSCVEHAITLAEPGQPQEFCLPLNYANNLFAIIQFRLKDNEQLSQNQIEIFENISPGISLALKAGQIRKNLAEIRSAEAALAERHSVSTYLHDYLSQNLAFLCLKLEQLSRGDENLTEKYKRVDLRHMMDAANQSYEILRDMLETMHPETTPRLINLMKEHAKKESERAHFDVSIESTGKEFAVSTDIQRAIFYVFRESLSNIEKHAKAKSVKVFLHWEKECLDVTIADDGIGFDLQNLDGSKHFGLDIMQERVDKVGGRIDVHSSIGSGTEIKISVPVLSLEKKGN